MTPEAPADPESHRPLLREGLPFELMLVRRVQGKWVTHSASQLITFAVPLADELARAQRYCYTMEMLFEDNQAIHDFLGDSDPQLDVLRTLVKAVRPYRQGIVITLEELHFEAECIAPVQLDGRIVDPFTRILDAQWNPQTTLSDSSSLFSGLGPTLWCVNGVASQSRVFYRMLQDIEGLDAINRVMQGLPQSVIQPIAGMTQQFGSSADYFTIATAPTGTVVVVFKDLELPPQMVSTRMGGFTFQAIDPLPPGEHAVDVYPLDMHDNTVCCPRDKEPSPVGRRPALDILITGTEGTP